MKTMPREATSPRSLYHHRRYFLVTGQCSNILIPRALSGRQVISQHSRSIALRRPAIIAPCATPRFDFAKPFPSHASMTILLASFHSARSRSMGCVFLLITHFSNMTARCARPADNIYTHGAASAAPRARNFSISIDKPRMTFWSKEDAN